MMLTSETFNTVVDIVICTLPTATEGEYISRCLKHKWTSISSATARYDIADISTDSSIYFPSPEDLLADTLEHHIVQAEERLRDGK